MIHYIVHFVIIFITPQTIRKNFFQLFDMVIYTPKLVTPGM